jgi:membrane protease YdiL (CAAX protease family)
MRLHPSNRDLLLPYCLPLLLYVGIGSLPDAWLSREASYGLRILACGGALAWAWRRYVPLGGPRGALGSVILGALAGLMGCVLWVALLLPLASTSPPAWDAEAFALRLAASALVVPLFEELLMRGYVLRLAVLWDRARRQGQERPLSLALDERSISEVEPGGWTPLAVVISVTAFTLGHTPPEWPAAAVYGLLMTGLWIIRRDLLSCVVGHAVTNAALAFYVRATGQWGLW